MQSLKAIVSNILNLLTIAKGGEVEMKKIFAVCLTVMVALALSTAVFAEETLKVKGTVTKIDTAAKSVTIQPKEGAAITVVMEDADMLDKVKEGGKGEAKYVVKDGKNVGTKLRKLSEGCQ
jgi:Cu/Ag efflux protein CusF